MHLGPCKLPLALCLYLFPIRGKRGRGIKTTYFVEDFRLNQHKSIGFHPISKFQVVFEILRPTYPKKGNFCLRKVAKIWSQMAIISEQMLQITSNLIYWPSEVQLTRSQWLYTLFVKNLTVFPYISIFDVLGPHKTYNFCPFFSGHSQDIGLNFET